MFKRIATQALILLLIGSLSSCIFDPKPAEVKKVPPVVYKELKEKNDVLFNLEQAYNQRDWDHYVEILDPADFVFFFYAGDVGGDVPASWGFTEESQSAKTMFNKGGVNPILSISLDLIGFENAQWIEFDPETYPGWYEATVSYYFKIDTENTTTYVTANSPRAQFRIRQDADGFWRLVQWNDLAGQ